MTALIVVLGVLLGAGTIIVFGLSGTRRFWLPILAKALENDPANPEKFTCTTKVGPGDQKFIMAGGTVARSIMNYSGHTHAGGDKAPECYEVVPTPSGATPDVVYANWLDELFHKETGYRFVNPFRERVFTYDFPRTKERVDEKGIRQLEHRSSTSDHFILTEQTHFFEFINLETGRGENVKVSMHGRVTVQIVNPYKTAFHDEKWLQQILAAMQVRAKDIARSYDFDTLLGESKNEGDTVTDKIGVELMKVNEQVLAGHTGTAKDIWGVIITRILMESPEMTDPEAEKKRTAKYTAARDAEVVRIAADAEVSRRTKLKNADATNEANYIKTVAQEVRTQGPIGVKLLDQQVELKYAEKAGTVIRGGTGQNIDPINAEILKHMQEGAKPAQHTKG